jgi:hypothetical protein
MLHLQGLFNSDEQHVKTIKLTVRVTYSIFPRMKETIEGFGQVKQ